MSETHDWTRRPFMESIHDDGQRIHVTFWSGSGEGPVPRTGDRLLLLDRKAGRSSRYLVESVRHASGEGDVVGAELRFDPRKPHEVKVDAERFGLDEGQIPYNPTRPVW